jgi:hypothetical protein
MKTQRAAGRVFLARLAPRPWSFPSMNGITLFGLIAVTAMLVFYAAEARSRWCILGFAASCMLGSAYGFLQGAWPFGIVEAIWSCVALRKWWRAPAGSP